MTLLLAFLIGFFAGLRSLTAPAATAWGVHLGWLAAGQPLTLIGSFLSFAIIIVLAVAELVADKLPKTPSRTAPTGLIARIAASGAQGIFRSAILGVIGGVVGCFGGYQARTGLEKALEATRDAYGGLTEDIVTVADSVCEVSQF